MIKIKSGIQVDGGWSIDSNVFVDKNFNSTESHLDNTLLFSAINHITGKSISISYENSNIGYSYDSCILYRHLGVWHYDESRNIYKTLKTDHNLDSFSNLLQNHLNPLQKNLIPLKISSWMINYNNLVEDTSLYSEVELIFSATRGKLFMDVVFYKNNNKPYYIYMGLSKYEYSEIIYNLNKTVSEYKEMFLENIEDVVALINNFLIGLDGFLFKILKKG